MGAAHRRAALALVVAATLFSTGGAAIKGTHFTGWQIASLRSGIAGLTLVLLLPGARRGIGWRPFVVGAAYAAVCICFVLATRLTTSANAIFLQFASPLYVMLLAPVLLGEPVARRDALFMVPVGIGLLLILFGAQTPAGTAPNPAAGNLIALAAGVAFAFAVIGLRWLGRSGSGGATPLTAAALGNFLAFALALPFALPFGEHSAVDWVMLLYLGVFQIGLAYWFVSYGISRLSALETSLLLLIEPALNPLWTWVVHGEKPGGTALAGGGLVLGATLVRALGAERARPPQNGSGNGLEGVPQT